jgi:hypothetical protein
MTEKLLWMCAVCKKIKDEYGNMFGEKDNPERYNNLIKKYEGNITQGLCDEDLAKQLKEHNNYFKNK